MAYRHRRRRRGQKGGFVQFIPALMSALAPTVAGMALSKISSRLLPQRGRGRRRIVARRYRYRNRP